LPPVDRWRVACELARRTGQRELPEGLTAFVDGLLAEAARDRCGVMLDSFGGYSIDLLYGLLPLLAGAGALTGDRRYFDEACLQLFGHQNWLEEPITRLWHSAFGRGPHPRRVTPGFWALGKAYCLAGVVDLLDHLPPDHHHYVDVICLMRGLVEALHEWLPVFGGWSQVLNHYDTFRCVSANGLLTYGCAKPVWRGWVKPAYYAAVWGGLYHLGHLVRTDGDFDLSSLPAGGLDTLEAYSSHCVTNDPSALGFILSGCAYGGICQESGRKFGEEDERLGAR
jgi:rhamnogalacturonyl hydrolase YesR